MPSRALPIGLQCVCEATTCHIEHDFGKPPKRDAVSDRWSTLPQRPRRRRASVASAFAIPAMAGVLALDVPHDEPGVHLGAGAAWARRMRVLQRGLSSCSSGACGCEEDEEKRFSRPPTVAGQIRRL